MRVIATARQTLTPGYERTLQRLVAILGVISKNPSNPIFDQYIFESISALMRFVALFFLLLNDSDGMDERF
jgi:exportin-2 (importin alpha re-exporter)